MITLSEALSNFSGTTNYVAKYTPTGNVLGLSQIFDNGTNVGIGTATPTSNLTIYSAITAGTTTFSVDSDTGNSSISLNSFISSYGTSGGGTINFNSNGTGYGIIRTNSSHSMLYINSLNGYNLILQDGTTSNVFINASYGVLFGNGVNNNFLSANNGNVAIGTNFYTPTSRLHIQGVDSTSSNYSLKVDNSASSPLLYVRNDGNVYSHGFGGISSNAAFGLDSLIAVSGLYNSAFGTNSLKANSTGIGNCAFGFESLKVNTSGNYSTSMGTQALYSNITGASNTAIGNAAMALNVSGATNTAIGKSALYNSTNSGNTAIGNQSLQALSTGSNNTAIGNQSGLNATGSGNVFIGYLAGASETGSNKFFIDNQARTNEATARVESLIYGIFAGLPVNQYLRFNANVGVGVDATAKLHVQGIDTTSGNYALKVDNSASSPLFYVRNDGVILANNLPTSASGLPSGAIWNNGGILNII